MKDSIQFKISQEDGVYTASGINVPIVTDATTFEELQTNIKEAIKLYFENDDSTAKSLGPKSSVVASLELII